MFLCFKVGHPLRFSSCLIYQKRAAKLLFLVEFITSTVNASREKTNILLFMNLCFLK